MARRSNKTSHVLNLLTDPKSIEPSEECQNQLPNPADSAPIEDATPSAPIEPMEAIPAETPEAVPTQTRKHSNKAVMSPAPLAQPSVDLSQALEERISQQIHDSLSAQLAEDEAKDAERAEHDREIAERIAAEMNAAMQADTASAEEENVKLEEEPSPDVQTEVPTEPESENDFELVNVMEAILDQFQAEFMEKFGMCTCHHCWLDTRALTLSSLSAKYVVLRRDSIEPMLNFYDHRYRGTIMAQLTQSCIAVMANPHH